MDNLAVFSQWHNPENAEHSLLSQETHLLETPTVVVILCDDP